MSDEITVEQPELTMLRIIGSVRTWPSAGQLRPCVNCSLYYSAELTACPKLQMQGTRFAHCPIGSLYGSSGKFSLFPTSPGAKS
jgi:hypothetical protein